MQYRELYNELQAVKGSQDHAARMCDECKAEVLAEFNTWYEASYGQEAAPEAGATAKAAVPRAALSKAAPAGQLPRAKKPGGGVPSRGGPRQTASAPVDYNPDTKAFYDAQSRVGRGHVDAAKKLAPKQRGMGTGSEGRSKGDFTMLNPTRLPGVF